MKANFLKFEFLSQTTGLPQVEPSYVGCLTLNRPEALNALNRELLTELNQFLGWVTEQKIRALIVTGAGEKAFVAGADIKEMKDFNEAQAFRMAKNGQELFQRLEELPFPTIAAVNGFALGGGLELAMSCDLMLASEKVKWGLPEVSLGLIPGYGGTQRLARYIGKSLAKRVVLTGEIFSAQQGYDWGLFAQVCPAGELLSVCAKVASTMATRAPQALHLAKEAIRQGLDQTQSEGLVLEAELFAKTFATEDHHEGLAAFIEKRQPQFQGK